MMLPVRILVSMIALLGSLVFRPGKLSFRETRLLDRAARRDALTMTAERRLPPLLRIDDYDKRMLMISYYHAAYIDYAKQFHGVDVAFINRELTTEQNEIQKASLTQVSDIA